MRTSKALCAVLAVAILAIVLASIDGIGRAAPGAAAVADSAARSLPASANPCEDGVSDITGTIQACTMITDSLGISSTLLTTTLEIAAGIQDAETGPTTHYSHTVGGQAFWYGLHPGRPWFVAVQVEDFPLKKVRRVGPLQIFGVYVGQAVTFHFECVEEPCDELAPTPTPRPTWVTPTRSATPTPTETGTPTLVPEETAEPTSVPPPTSDPAEPTPGSTPGEPTPEPTGTEPSGPTSEPGETPSPTPVDEPGPTPDPPGETPAPEPPTALPEPPTADPPPSTDVPPATGPPPTDPSPRTIYLPALMRRW